MQSTARCARCGGGEFTYHEPLARFGNPKPGGIYWVVDRPPTFTFGCGPEATLYAEIPADKRLCCTSCGYWEKTWSPAGEGSPQRAGADQAMGGAGHVPGNMVPASHE